MINSLLEDSFPGAVNGVESSIRAFLRAFLAGPLYVPVRHQRAPLSNSPEYPNDFINILGIKDTKRIIVPVFSEVKKIDTWFGAELEYRTFQGRDLAQVIPSDWWVCVNPGSDYEKELSPWELEALKGGEQSTEALVQELIEDEQDTTLNIRPLGENEYTELRSRLTDFVCEQDAIRALYCAIETEDTASRRILIGLEFRDKDGEVLQEVEALVRSSLIGDLPYVLVNVKEDRMANGVLIHFPLLKKDEEGVKRSLWDRLRALWDRA